MIAFDQGSASLSWQSAIRLTWIDKPGKLMHDLDARYLTARPSRLFMTATYSTLSQVEKFVPLENLFAS